MIFAPPPLNAVHVHLMSVSEIFGIQASVPELALRGSLIYLGILFLLRILPRRTGGQLEPMDLVFILLIAEAAAPAMGDYRSVTEGFVVVAIFMTWNYLMNVVCYYFPAVERMIINPPILVIRQGKLLRKNMRREYLTEEELRGQLRGHGIEDLAQVRKAYIESDGTISVVRYSNP